MKRSRKRIGYVYFAREVSGGAIKIGYTASLPTHRLTCLAVGRGTTLELVGLMVGDKKTESEMHRQFEELRIEGEWFKPGEQLEQFITTLPYKTANGLGQLVGLRFDQHGRMERAREDS